MDAYGRSTSLCVITDYYFSIYIATQPKAEGKVGGCTCYCLIALRSGQLFSQTLFPETVQ